MKVTEDDTERNGFLSYPTEVHAAAAGAAPGLFLGMTWGTSYEAAGMAAGSAVLLAALGVKKLSNKKLGAEIRLEAQYTLGAMVAFVLVGLAVNMLI